MTHDEKYHRKPWMSDDQWECAQMMAEIYGGFHHLINDIKPCGRGIENSVYASTLSTFDNSRLTTAVLLAHDRMIRLELSNSSHGRIKVLLHKRHTREGSSMSRHPTIGQAIERHRQHYAELT